MRIRFIYKSVGKFSLLIVFILSSYVQAEANFGTVTHFDRVSTRDEWADFQRMVRERERLDRIDGLSYIISGSLAVAGGLFGQGLTSDPLEKGVYTLFQTIGVASIGYGFYTWRIGNDDRLIYEMVNSTGGLDERERSALVHSYLKGRREREQQDKVIRAITHSLIATLNFYGATQQKNQSVRNALIFLGGVNTLAALSFTF